MASNSDTPDDGAARLAVADTSGVGSAGATNAAPVPESAGAEIGAFEDCSTAGGLPVNTIGSAECSTQSAKLTPTELGKLWGTSRAYASKCIKNGCPTDSIEAANQWRKAKSRYGIGYRSKHKPAAVEQQPSASKTQNSAAEERGDRERADRDRADLEVGVEAGGLASLERSLRKAIEVENEAHRLVAEAQRGKNDDTISIRIAAYTKAQKGRLDAEEQIVKLKEKIGLLISVDKAKALIRRSFLPLLTRLRSLPKRAAFKANPADDVHAEAVLKLEIEEVISEWRGQYRGEGEEKGGAVDGD